MKNSKYQQQLINKFISVVRPLPVRSIVDLAEKYLMIKEGDLLLSCSFDLIPYFKEVANNAASANKIAIVAGARCGKTITLQAIAAAAAAYTRENVLFMHSNEKSLLGFVKNEFNDHFSKVLKEFCSKDNPKAEDNQTNKIFNNGNFLNLIFPTSSNFRSKQCNYFLMTEFDAYEDLKEGCLFTLASKRTMVLDGCVVAESTPKHTAKKHSNNKHGLPNAAGITSAYNKGSRAFFYWSCPSCKESISPNYKDLIFEDDNFFVVCNKCSYKISEDQKAELNEEGFWIHADDTRKKVGFLSYYLSPIFAAFLRWDLLYFEYQDALSDLKNNYDSEKMRAFLNVSAGLPFVESDFHFRSVDNIGLDNSSNCSFGIVPDDAFFIYATVDAQGGKDRRFEICIFAYCEGQRTAIIKRYSVNNVNDQPLEINLNTKHFGILTDLLDLSFSNSNKTRKYKIVCVGVDSNGEHGYFDNLINFYRKLTRNQKQRIYLLKGSKPFSSKQKEKSLGSKVLRSNFAGYSLYLLESTPLKGVLFNRLALDSTKDQSYLFYNDFPVKYKNEIESEHLVNGIYVKRSKSLSNETLDLIVYASVMLIISGADKHFNQYKKMFSFASEDI